MTCVTLPFPLYKVDPTSLSYNGTLQDMYEINPHNDMKIIWIVILSLYGGEWERVKVLYVELTPKIQNAWRAWNYTTWIPIKNVYNLSYKPTLSSCQRRTVQSLLQLKNREGTNGDHLTCKNKCAPIKAFIYIITKSNL